MKKIKLVNILLIFIFAVFLFQGDEAEATRSKGYDAQIKSNVAQIRNMVEICYDNNKGSYLNCGTLEVLGLNNFNIKPPICSDDKEYNIAISEDGKSYAIWGDLVGADGYWCVDSAGGSKTVANDIIPTKESTVCPEDGNYVKKDKNSNECQKKENFNSLLSFISFFFLFIIVLYFILNIILSLINIVFWKNKLSSKEINRKILKLILIGLFTFWGGLFLLYIMINYFLFFIIVFIFSVLMLLIKINRKNKIN